MPIYTPTTDQRFTGARSPRFNPPSQQPSRTTTPVSSGKAQTTTTYKLGDVMLTKAEYDAYQKMTNQEKFEFQKTKGLIPKNTPYETYTTTYVPGTPTYNIGGVDVPEIKYRTYINGDDQKKFAVLVDIGLIPQGSQFVPGLTQAQIDDIKQKYEEAVRLGISPPGGLDNITPHDWGYYTPEDIDAFNAWTVTRGQELQQLAINNQNAANLAQKETNIASTENIDVRLVDTPKFSLLSKDQSDALFSLAPYAVVYKDIGKTATQPAYSVLKDKDVVYNIDRYLQDHPDGANALATLGVDKKEIDLALARVVVYEKGEKIFDKLNKATQAILIERYLGRKYRGKTLADLTPDEINTVYFNTYTETLYRAIDESGGIGSPPLAKTLFDKATGKSTYITNPDAKYTAVKPTNALISLAGLITPVAVIEPTPVGDIIVASLLAAGSIVATVKLTSQIKQQIADYKAATGRYPTANEITLNIDGKTTSLADVSKATIVRMPARPLTSYPPRDMTLQPGTSVVRMPTRQMGSVTPRITTKEGATLVNMPVRPAGNATRKITPKVYAAQAAILESAAVRRALTPAELDRLWRLGDSEWQAPGSTYIRGTSLRDLDSKVSDAFIRGGMSRAEYDEYLQARQRYLIAKGITSSSQTSTDNMTLRKGKISTKVLTAIATAAALNAAQSVLANPATQSLTKTQVKVEVRTAAQEAAKQAIKTTTATQTATATQIATATSVATKTAVQTATATQTAVQTAEAVKTATATATAVGVRTNVAEAEAELEAEATLTGIKGNLPGGKTVDNLTKAERVGAVSWKQGIGYWVRYPPYRQQDSLFTMKPPKGITISPDAKSAFDTIQTLKGSGKAPGSIPKFDMGIVDVFVNAPQSPRRGNRNAIKFRPDSDARQGTQQQNMSNKKVGQYFIAGQMVSRKPIGKKKRHSNEYPSISHI
jgi:hypothetical protein